tara:strand:- start:577 stop:1026 length:450 start_codon:yes stop_codon:yes gene_type:complete
MVVRDGLSMIVIERAKHRSLTTVPLDIVVDRDLAKTALGRAYLALLPKCRRTAMLENIRQVALEMLTTVEAGMKSGLAYFQTHGYTISGGDWMTDYHAVRMPLVLSNGNILAFNCGGFASQINLDDLPNLSQKLSAMVDELGRTQGASR